MTDLAISSFPFAESLLYLAVSQLTKLPRYYLTKGMKMCMKLNKYST